MKKFTLILAFCMAFLLTVTAFAQDITVTVNGTVLETDVPAEIVSGRTMLPMRVIFEELGARVTWIEADRLIFATHGDTLLVLQIDNFNMNIQKTGSNENVVVELDAAPYISNSRTMVPVRAVAEALSANVDWIEESWTVVITTN